MSRKMVLCRLWRVLPMRTFQATRYATVSNIRKGNSSPDAVLGDLRRWLGGVLAACGMGPSISYNV